MLLNYIIFLQGSGHVHGMGPLQAHSMGWPRVQGIPTTPIVKRVVRLDVPVDKYPNVSQNIFMLGGDCTDLLPL